MAHAPPPPGVANVRHGTIPVPPAGDIVVAAALAVVVAAGTVAVSAWQPDARPVDLTSVALVTVAALALAWRRTFPVATLGVVVSAVGVHLLAGYGHGPVQLCVVLAMFEVARLRPLRASLLACLAALAVTLSATVPHAMAAADVPFLLLAVLASWLVVPWSLGALAQARSVAVRRARRELVARTALEERMRVAREVHDVAGHGFAAVAMQAGVALLVFEDDPEQARRSLRAIRDTSTSALAELRATLETVTTPGLPAVPSLVESVRAAGVPVTLSLAVDGAPEPAGQVAYRVVQEALANVLRHAGATTAEVRVHRDRDELVVQVRDRGGPAGPDPAVPAGHPGRGIDGMRARVAELGGRLDAGPVEGAGFQVTARLPLGELA